MRLRLQQFTEILADAATHIQDVREAHATDYDQASETPSDITMSSAERLRGDSGSAEIEDFGKLLMIASIGVLAINGADIMARGENAAAMPGLMGVGGLVVGTGFAVLGRLTR